MKKRRFIALILLFSMFGSGVVSYADKVDDLKKEKQNQEQNVENKKKSIQDMTTEKDAAFKEIVEKQKRIEQLDKDLTDLEDLINKISEEIQASKDKITILEDRITEKQELFKKRVRVMYGNKDLNSIEVLFSASDIRDFISRYFMMQSIADYDKKLITSLKNDKLALVKEKEQLEARKEEKVVKKKEMEIKYQAYTEEVEKNKQRIAKLEESIEYTKSEVDKLQSKVKSLDANISFEEKVKAIIKDKTTLSEVIQNLKINWRLKDNSVDSFTFGEINHIYLLWILRGTAAQEEYTAIATKTMKAKSLEELESIEWK